MPNPLVRALQTLLLLAAAVFFALHYVHPTADFPNNSPWMDWSKYTDEGWYGDAAIRHFQLGHWYVAGDFNPAAALPVWPFLEGLLFHFTGVSLTAARALTVTVFGGILVVSWLLLRRWSSPQALAPAVAVLLLAVSPFCYVFTRLAILEPLLILLGLLTLLAAGAASPAIEGRRLWLVVAALGLLAPAMILTKTTAVFLMPSIAWLLFAAVGYGWRPFLRVALPAAAVAGAIWGAYFLLLVRPHYLLDYRYLFSANAYTGITRENAASVLRDTVRDGMWMGKLLFPLALLSVAVAAASFKRMRELPLIPTLMLWAAGYVAFLAYHDNLQPRYYLVVAVPLILLVPYVLEQAALPRFRRPWPLAAVCGVCLATVALTDARATLGYIRRPEYTLVQAAEGIRGYIDQDRRKDPQHNPLVLSISGSDISLMTGLHSICDDFGTLQLVDRVKLFRPGWYVAWNQIDDDKMDALTPLYHVERVAVFPAMDDPERNLLILYRLEDSIHTKPDLRHRKTIPKQLRTKVGQQPSPSQLEH
ncbi:hypothetical protein SAMN05421770_106156 [Granulicella rosea]|uniref:Dolichyl-phosphate-mannose-protein mannosyltransferase n=1 Tax=Granulicella rosea TaxID=474952 RepID=A0A239L949_9BACT|nr:hypothetical protein [Granulicella rosea]SNT26199.1 hypothetical protein SAMN05421770_106156 [Granulicella rosea]